jgi:hypothetical protein
MDARYNMINWVHRSTRGWSYGAAVSDPRTGEIIKGNVSLGSLRIRQDFLLGTGMIPPYAAQTRGMNDLNDACLFSEAPDIEYLTADAANDSAAMSLARIRQLSAHEVGHTLGFAHNFAASSYNRGSVMDYPAPLVEIKDGKLDLSNAYATGIGAFDKFAVKYAYADIRANEDAELDKIVAQGVSEGMLFIADEDARGLGTAHPLASIWDNGDDPVAMLRHEMRVRRIGLANFGLNSVPAGTPLSELEAKLLPLYLHHRYQTASALKSVGGMYFTYAVKGKSAVTPAKYREIVASERQREALEVVLDTLKPEELALSPRLVALIPPRATGFDDGTGEYFAGRTDPALDVIGMATIAADMTLAGLLDPRRAARMIAFNAEAGSPHFRETTDALITRIFKTAPSKQPYHLAILEAEQRLLVNRFMDLAANSDAASSVRAVANDALHQINEFLKARTPDAHERLLQQDIERFFTRPDAQRTRTPALPVPAGEPIGQP